MSKYSINNLDNVKGIPEDLYEAVMPVFSALPSNEKSAKLKETFDTPIKGLKLGRIAYSATQKTAKTLASSTKVVANMGASFLGMQILQDIASDALAVRSAVFAYRNALQKTTGTLNRERLEEAFGEVVGKMKTISLYQDMIITQIETLSKEKHHLDFLERQEEDIKRVTPDELYTSPRNQYTDQKTEKTQKINALYQVLGALIVARTGLAGGLEILNYRIVNYDDPTADDIFYIDYPNDLTFEKESDWQTYLQGMQDLNFQRTDKWRDSKKSGPLSQLPDDYKTPLSSQKMDFLEETPEPDHQSPGFLRSIRKNPNLQQPQLTPPPSQNPTFTPQKPTSFPKPPKSFTTPLGGATQNDATPPTPTPSILQPKPPQSPTPPTNQTTQKSFLLMTDQDLAYERGLKEEKERHAKIDRIFSTSLAQIAAEEMGLRPDDPDTNKKWWLDQTGTPYHMTPLYKDFQKTKNSL